MDTKIIKFDIIKARGFWFVLSIAVMVAGLASIAVRGLNVGIDFTGGRIIQYKADEKMNASAVEKALRDAGKSAGLKVESHPVQIIGDGKSFQVRMKDYAAGDEAKEEEQEKAKDLQDTLAAFRIALAVDYCKIKPGKFVLEDIEKDLTEVDVARFAAKNKLNPALIEFVSSNMRDADKEDAAKRFDVTLKLKGELASGDRLKQTARAFYKEYGGHRQFSLENKIDPVFGKELVRRAGWTLLLATALILVYVTLRFEFWFGLAAILALFHDTIITIGLYSLLGLEVNSSTVAVVLTVFGYSINDTIIIFDRIRENRRKHKREPLMAVMDFSLWETMPRSINTVMTTIIPLIAIIIFGGLTLQGFCTGMLGGILSGCYSSLFVAAPLAFVFKARQKEDSAAAIVGAGEAPARRAARTETARPQTRTAKETAAKKTTDAATPGADGDKTTDKKSQKRSRRR